MIVKEIPYIPSAAKGIIFIAVLILSKISEKSKEINHLRIVSIEGSISGPHKKITTSTRMTRMAPAKVKITTTNDNRPNQIPVDHKPSTSYLHTQDLPSGCIFPRMGLLFSSANYWSKTSDT